MKPVISSPVFAAPLRRGGSTKYPWDALGVGQAFEFDDISIRVAVNQCSEASRHRRPKRFLARRLARGGIAAVRVK